MSLTQRNRPDNIHARQAGFEPTIQEREWPQYHFLDRAVTGIVLEPSDKKKTGIPFTFFQIRYSHTNLPFYKF